MIFEQNLRGDEGEHRAAGDHVFEYAQSLFLVNDRERRVLVLKQ